MQVAPNADNPRQGSLAMALGAQYKPQVQPEVGCVFAGPEQAVHRSPQLLAGHPAVGGSQHLQVGYDRGGGRNPRTDLGGNPGVGHAAAEPW